MIFVLEKSEDGACEACSDTSQAAGKDQITNFAKSCPEWEMKTELDIIFLTRTYLFPDFVQASASAGKVGTIADQANHHPRIIIEYGKTRVERWSHKIANIHPLDLKLAADTDKLFKTNETN